jgi:hypothetical protein
MLQEIVRQAYPTTSIAPIGQLDQTLTRTIITNSKFRIWIDERSRWDASLSLFVLIALVSGGMDASIHPPRASF